MEGSAQEKLIHSLREAHAMEGSMIRLLDSVIRAAGDGQVDAELREEDLGFRNLERQSER